jgi:integrase
MTRRRGNDEGSIGGTHGIVGSCPARAPRESDLVFTTAGGRALNPSNVRRAFGRLLKRAGLPVVPFHPLRHSCATLLLAAGVSPKHVQEQLGPHSVAFTLSVYGHVLPDERTTAGRRLDALLAGKRVG